VHGGTQLTLSLHALGVLLGVAAGALLAIRRGGATPPILLGVTVVPLAALAGAHALFRALHGGPGALWTGGLTSTGGVAAGLAAMWATARLTRRPPGDLLDALVPAGLIGLAVGRLGCFLGGCCYGRPTSLPWGVVFPELGPPPRHPLQLYSAAGDGALLLVLPWRGARPGVLARRACVGFGLLRAGLELLRDAGTTDLLPGGWLTLPQAAALVLAAGAAFLRPHGPSDYASPPEGTRAWRMRSR